MSVPAGYEVYTENGVDYLFKRVGTRGAPRGEQWLECVSCGECFPVSETMKIAGQTWGVPCGCAAYKRRDLAKVSGDPRPARFK